MPNRFLRLLQTRPWLLADGATGTNLMAAGLAPGEAPERWNLLHPDRIADLHRGFIEAGSDIVLTNSFGANRYRLAMHGDQARLAEFNRAAAAIARGEAGRCGREVAVAGSIGPLGAMLEPLGTCSFDAARDAFAEQAQALREGGVDVLWIETMSDLREVEAAIAGAARVGLPVVCTMSFDTNGRTMMGVTPQAFAASAGGSAAPLAAYGANCGVGPAEVVACLLNLARAAGPEAVLVAKANCGIPEFVDGAIRYDGTPEVMAVYARCARDAGARIIGGCCGTGPAHIRAMRSALETHEPAPIPEAEAIVNRLGEISTGAHAQLQGKLERIAGAAPGALTVARAGGRRRR